MTASVEREVVVSPPQMNTTPKNPLIGRILYSDWCQLTFLCLLLFLFAKRQTAETARAEFETRTRAETQTPRNAGLDKAKSDLKQTQTNIEEMGAESEKVRHCTAAAHFDPTRVLTKRVCRYFTCTIFLVRRFAGWTPRKSRAAHKLTENVKLRAWETTTFRRHLGICRFD